MENNNITTTESSVSNLVLSLFPGIGLLDTAFEEAGFCVVRGPDTLWGGDVKRFHPPARRFNGVIGGPPCKQFCPLANISKKRWGEQSVAENLIPEYERCVAEAQPDWFLMENVRRAPEPVVPGYAVASIVINNRHFGAEQNRERRISFGVRGLVPVKLSRYLDVALFEAPQFEPCVTGGWGGSGGAGLKVDRDGKPRPKGKYVDRRRAASKRTWEERCRLQGLPPDFLMDKYSPFSMAGRLEMLGNGVPLPMGRALAAAVKRYLEEIGYIQLGMAA